MRHLSKLIVRDSCLMLEARRVRSNARITNSLCYGNLKGNGNSKGNTDSQNTGQGGSLSHGAVPGRAGQNIHISLLLLQPVRDHIHTQKLHPNNSTPKAIGGINSHNR